MIIGVKPALTFVFIFILIFSFSKLTLVGAAISSVSRLAITAVHLYRRKGDG
jgi:hypothetical protein